MRTGELDCIHGVGHSAGIHGCDGCCIPLVQQARAEAWEEGMMAFDFAIVQDKGEGNPWQHLPENPYRQGEN